ncbi:hypothetical protein L798_11254 [Zootermopsis nevadensis]|uniref:Uncharacterized protein n=1 Tax=Zootermopsis nevadensis TaxID=136037 RepID=A0A067QEK6_ZOONE|nr:hypothetical protein L798_11254 [Zootermopsis nevadensis]
MKERAAIRKERCKKGVAKWELSLRDPVLVRIMPVSDAGKGVTGKFIRPFEGPYFISKALSPGMFELEDKHGKPRGMFNNRELKPFRMENDVLAEPKCGIDKTDVVTVFY